MIEMGLDLKLVKSSGDDDNRTPWEVVEKRFNDVWRFD